MDTHASEKSIMTVTLPTEYVLLRKRIFDTVLSFLGLLILSPLFLLCLILVSVTSPGAPIFKQERIGQSGVPFTIYKFRTMRDNNSGLKITAENDGRITAVGKILRKTKLDELPQLFNVLIGDMSFVGPRPEVSEYVRLYDERQKLVLSVRPGITGLASIRYVNENELLSKSDDPNRTYIEEIIPAKIELDLQYIPRASVSYDIRLIFETLFTLLGK